MDRSPEGLEPVVHLQALFAKEYARVAAIGIDGHADDRAGRQHDLGIEDVGDGIHREFEIIEKDIDRPGRKGILKRHGIGLHGQLDFATAVTIGLGRSQPPRPIGILVALPIEPFVGLDLKLLFMRFIKDCLRSESNACMQTTGFNGLWNQDEYLYQRMLASRRFKIRGRSV